MMLEQSKCRGSIVAASLLMTLAIGCRGSAPPPSQKAAPEAATATPSRTPAAPAPETSGSAPAARPPSAPSARTADIDIQTEPTGAEVVLGLSGRRVGRTPCRVGLETSDLDTSGNVTVTMTLDGFAPATRTVHVGTAAKVGETFVVSEILKPSSR